MASTEKARKFLEESESHRHYSSIVEYALTFFIARAEKQGKTRFAAELRDLKDAYHEEFRQAVDVTERVYAETFTDEELDDLIILHSNPALRRARALTAEIFEKILQEYVSASA